MLVGIALDKTVKALRTQVSSKLQEHHHDLEEKFKIKSQNDRENRLSNDNGSTFHKSCEPKKILFNYKSLMFNQGKQRANFTFNISDHNELGRLYLLPHMAKYTAIDDDTCDSSALLNIIEKASCFSTTAKAAAKNVREKVRNQWGHPKMREWTEDKLSESFKLLIKLAQELNCDVACLQEIQQLQDEGIKSLSGGYVNNQLLAQMEQDIRKVCQMVERQRDLYENPQSIIYLLNIASRLQAFQEENREYHEENREYHEDLKQKIDILQRYVARHLPTWSRKVFLLPFIFLIILALGIAVQYYLMSHRLDFESSTSSHAKFTNLPSRNRLFLFRKAEVKSTMDWFDDSKNKTFVLSGPGGVGKTSIALEAGWQINEKYQNMDIYWLTSDDYTDAEKSFILDESIKSLSNQLKLNGNSVGDLTNYFKELRHPFLVIIDNLDQAKFSRSVTELIRGNWLQNENGKLLITSRLKPDVFQQFYDQHYKISSFELNFLSPAEGGAMIKYFVEPDQAIIKADRYYLLNVLVRYLDWTSEVKPLQLTDTVLEEISSEFGGLPLALKQAAVCIRHYYNGDYASFLEVVKETETKQKILSDENLNPESQSVLKILTIQVNWLQNECPNCVLFLKIIAESPFLPIYYLNSGWSHGDGLPEDSVIKTIIPSALKNDYEIKSIVRHLTKFYLIEEIDTIDNFNEMHSDDGLYNFKYLVSPFKRFPAFLSLSRFRMHNFEADKNPLLKITHGLLKDCVRSLSSCKEKVEIIIAASAMMNHYDIKVAHTYSPFLILNETRRRLIDLKRLIFLIQYPNKQLQADKKLFDEVIECLSQNHDQMQYLVSYVSDEVPRIYLWIEKMKERDGLLFSTTVVAALNEVMNFDIASPEDFEKSKELWSVSYFEASESSVHTGGL